MLRAFGNPLPPILHHPPFQVYPPFLTNALVFGRSYPPFDKGDSNYGTYHNMKQKWAYVTEKINQMKKGVGMDSILQEEKG